MPVVRYIPNFSTCFSCDNLQSPTSRCQCGFNVDTVCEKLIGLCKRGEVPSINSIAYIIESFTLKNVKKISSKFGYVSSITLTLAAKVCAIEFAMRSNWFKYGLREMLYAAMSEVEELLRFCRSNQGNTQNERMFVWNFSIRNRKILTPPAIGVLRRDIYLSKLRFAKYIQTELAAGRYFREPHTQILLLPDNITYTVSINPIRTNGITVVVPVVVPEVETSSEEFDRIDAEYQPNRQDETIRLSIDASLETQRIEREKQIAENNVKTWKSISIITNVLEKSEDITSEPVTCPICYYDISHSKKSRTNCGHSVCSDCVSDVITKCGANCVICRTVITHLEFGSIAEIVKCQENKIKIISA